MQTGIDTNFLCKELRIRPWALQICKQCPMDATTSGAPTIQYHNLADQPIATTIEPSTPQAFERQVRQCLGNSTPGDFPLAASPSIVLHVLTACNLDPQDLAKLEATCSFFRQPARFAPDYDLSIAELAALDLCHKRAIFRPMTSDQRDSLKLKCGGSWKLVLRYLLAGEACCRREKSQAIAGPGHSVAVTSKGAVYSFGSNSLGQLGHGPAMTEDGDAPPPDEFRPRPIRCLQGIRIIQAAVGAGRTMLVSDIGRVYAFGKEAFGEAEYGPQGSTVSTPQIVESLKDTFVVQAAIGNFFTAVLSREGRIHTFSWGSNARLGHQTDSNDTHPHPLLGALENVQVVQIAAGYCYLLALACEPTGMSVYSVGCGLGGKLGHGSRTDEKTPRLIEQFGTLKLQPMVVAAGAWHAAVVGASSRGEKYVRRSLDTPELSLDGPLSRNDEARNNLILQQFCSKGLILKASHLVDLMARRNQVPHYPSCINLIRGLIKKDNLEKAVRVLKVLIMSGGVPDIITYNMLVHGFCKQGQMESAIDIVEDMSFSGCPPDVITYNTIIRCLFDKNKFDEAIDFWRKQLRKGNPPYTLTYTIIVEKFFKRFGPARALEILEDLIFDGCYPDTVIYNLLLRFTCKRGNFEDTALVMHNMMSHELDPDAVTYNTLLSAFCSHGYWNEVDHILSLMNQTGHPATVVTYNVLINGLCKCGLLDRAIDFLEEMVSKSYTPDIITYNILLCALCREGMADYALHVMELLISSGCSPSLITYNTVIDGLAKKGNMKKAVQLYGEMIKKGINPDDVTHRSLVWGFCWSDDVEGAVEILREMGRKDQKIRNSAYKHIIHGLCRDEKVDVAIQVLEIMTSGDSKPDPSLYMSIVKGVAAAGMKETASELCDRLIEWKFLPEDIKLI